MRGEPRARSRVFRAAHPGVRASGPVLVRFFGRGWFRAVAATLAGCALSACVALAPAPAGPAGNDETRRDAGARDDAEEAGARGARTYSGTYSCDGCDPRRLTVTIFADGRYRLREVPERGAPLDEQGRWSVGSTASDRLVLESDAGVRVLRRTAPDALVLVDPEGRELHGLVGGVFERTARIDLLPHSERLAGLYRRDGQAAAFVDCGSGEMLRVLPLRGRAQAALDAAVAELAPHADETVLVVVRAHRVPLGSGESGREAIVVDAFERATRSGLCDGPMGGER